MNSVSAHVPMNDRPGPPAGRFGKEVIRKLTIERAEKIAKRASEIDVARDVENYLWGELKRLCPESMQLD